MKRTRALEILDEAKVSYQLREFPAVEFSAEEVASKLEIPLAQVFKTLVLEGDKTGTLVAIVPGDKELNLKKLAQVSGNKQVQMIKVADLQRLTGYLKGGCSPLGMRKLLPTYIDRSASAFAFISVSAGLRGLQIFISFAELKRVINLSETELI